MRGRRRGDGDTEEARLSSIEPHRTEIQSVVEAGSVHALLQPVVDFGTGRVVGHEALARGPAGSSLAAPMNLFDAAREANLTARLDWACRLAAVSAAETARIGPPAALFVNVEPTALLAPGPTVGESVWIDHLRRGHVVIEVTERSLAADPAGVLSALTPLRRLGARVALDDVGTHPESLALLPFIQPEVIKLDRSIVQEPASERATDVVHAVAAESERTGAVIVAEGIETEEHAAAAQAMGATLGQGWYFGRPAPAETVEGDPGAGLRFDDEGRLPVDGATPYEIVSSTRPVRRATKGLLLPMTKRLESHAAARGDGAVVLTALQTARNFSEGTIRRYARLARSATFVGALGVGVDGMPADGVRGASLPDGDPLADEWTITVVCPHFAAALVARDLRDDGPDMERRFDFAVTYNRALVVEAGRSLMSRIAPAG